MQGGTSASEIIHQQQQGCQQSKKPTIAGVGACREGLQHQRLYISNSKDASKARKPIAAGVRVGSVASGRGYNSNSKDASKARKPTASGIGG